MKGDGKAAQEKEKEEDFLVDSLRERLEERKTMDKNKSGKLLYAASGFLFLVVLAIGVTLLNSNEKIASIQTSVDTLLESLAENETRQQEAKQGENALTATEKEGNQKITAATVAREMATTQPATQPATQPTTPAAPATEETTAAADVQPPASTEAPATNPPESVETVNKKPVSHIVGKGETLESISRSIYGNTSMVEEICKKNNITNPDSIYAGQEILLP